MSRPHYKNYKKKKAHNKLLRQKKLREGKKRAN